MFKTQILKKEKVAFDTWEIKLKKPENFGFYPGQYIEIDFRQRDRNDFIRNFTIYSSPFENFISIITNRGISDYKNRLFSLPNNSEVLISEAHGKFILDENLSEKVFLGGGIGIAPFKSIILEMNESGLKSKLTLIASFSKKEEIFFYDEFKSLENKNLKIIYTLSNDFYSKFERGRINENLIKKNILNFKKVKFYCCGSFSFNVSMEEMLLKMGVTLSKIKSESIITDPLSI